MVQQDVQAIVLAAGKSSRFNTTQTKLSFTLCGQEMIAYPIKMLNSLNIDTTIVVGYQKDAVKDILKKYNQEVNYIEQENQLGTGHAVLCTKKNWNKEHILIINGDMPLITTDIIQNLVKSHLESNAMISFVIAHNTDPNLEGYGRVIKKNGKISIFEARGNHEEYCCINAGIYLVKRTYLENILPKIEKNQISQEIYLTDIINKASENNEPINTITIPFDVVRGINTLKELWIAELIKRSELVSYWMNQGVRFTFPQSVHIDYNVIIGKDTVIGAGVHLYNGTKIGTNCLIDSYSIVHNSTINDYSTIHPHSYIKDSHILKSAQIGPFAHVRNESIIGEQTIIGNFVEVSKSSINSKTKAKHLSYIGNAEIGSHVNIGACTVTCNYNGSSKNKTIIENDAFVGSNSALIAPVKVGKNSIIAAGSTITENIPDDALAIARSRQINKENYAPILKQKHKTKDVLKNKKVEYSFQN